MTAKNEKNEKMSDFLICSLKDYCDFYKMNTVTLTSIKTFLRREKFTDTKTHGDKIKKAFGDLVIDGILIKKGNMYEVSDALSRPDLDKNKKDTKFYGSADDSTLVEKLERNIVWKKPNVCWDDVADLQEAKRLLREAVILPLLIPDFFQGPIRRPWKGVLLFGPPGTGKTMLAKALASECKATYFNVPPSSLASKHRGESPKLVSLLFQRAQFHAPSIIFIDEIDSLFSRRGLDSEHEESRLVKSEFLTQLEGLISYNDSSKMVTLIGATNHPWSIDEALLRRLEKRIYIPLPTAEGREDLLQISLREITVSPEINIPDIVRKTEGFSAADITNLIREAAMMGFRKKTKDLSNEEIRCLPKAVVDSLRTLPVLNEDFEQALLNVKASVNQSDVKKYREWMELFGSK